jgi:hypothetical protein
VATASDEQVRRTEDFAAATRPEHRLRPRAPVSTKIASISPLDLRERTSRARKLQTTDPSNFVSTFRLAANGKGPGSSPSVTAIRKALALSVLGAKPGGDCGCIVAEVTRYGVK